MLLYNDFPGTEVRLKLPFLKYFVDVCILNNVLGHMDIIKEC